MRKKNCVCYHCKGQFRAVKKKILFLFLIIALITAIFDVLALYMIAGTNLIGIIIMNIIAVTAGFFLIPYFVEFKK